MVGMNSLFFLILNFCVTVKQTKLNFIISLSLVIRYAICTRITNTVNLHYLAPFFFFLIPHCRLKEIPKCNKTGDTWQQPDTGHGSPLHKAKHQTPHALACHCAYRLTLQTKQVMMLEHLTRQ